jgi:hypothetical protein
MRGRLVSNALWIAFSLQLASILALFAVREIHELPAYPSAQRQ